MQYCFFMSFPLPPWMHYNLTIVTEEQLISNARIGLASRHTCLAWLMTRINQLSPPI